MAITSLARILGSMAMIVFAGAVAAGATGAFFSDTETSTGNTFTAGSIDLQIDNESYVTNSEGDLVASTETSWDLADLSGELFFSFTDLKPGGYGEDTISLHPGSNNAWACMAVAVTGTPENSLEEAEVEANDPGTAQGDDGELQNYLNFAFWRDDGDNVFEVGEPVMLNLSGAAATVFNGAWNAIADSANLSAIPANDVSYVGKAWCFGTLTQTPVSQDGQGKTGSNGPLQRGTGFSCNGSGNQNDAQSDGVVADVSFYAEQSRNNPNFLCADLPPMNEAADITSASPTIVSQDFSPEMGATLARDADAYLGRTITYTGPVVGADPDTIKWRITINGPAGLDPTDVDMDEVGYNDPPNGVTLGTFHYPFQVVDADTVQAIGSCSTPSLHDNGCATDAFSLDADDVFSNADKVNFAATAPTGAYTIKYELVNTNGGAVIGTYVVAVTVI